MDYLLLRTRNAVLPSGNPAQVPGDIKPGSFRMGEHAAGYDHKTKPQMNILVRLEQFGMMFVQAFVVKRVDVDDIRRCAVSTLKGLRSAENMIQHGSHSRKCVGSDIMLGPDYFNNM